MARHLLTDRRVRTAKPQARPYRLADGDGLYLYVPPSGVLAWQFRYRLDGKQLTTTLGRGDLLSLAEAREAALLARKRVAEGQHLTVLKRVHSVKRRAQLGSTFAAVAADWVEREARRMRWTPDYKAEVEASLRNHLGELDRLPVTEITAAVTAPLLRSVDRRAPDMAVKVRRRLRTILDHAVEEGLLPLNPLPASRRTRVVERRHFAAVLDRGELGEILRRAERSDVCAGVLRAHHLLVFCAQRIGEIVEAEWNEFDLEGATWTIPRERMKRRDPERGDHLIPIPPLLLRHLREWRRVDGE